MAAPHPTSPPPQNLPNLAPTGSTSQPPLDLPIIEGLPFTDAQLDDFREQDRWLPIANVSRIMKHALPSNAKISKEAKECVQECVSEFISFITSEAAEKCLNEKRKTINGEDVLTSMRSLGFDNYEGVLQVFLAKFREHQLTQARIKLVGDDEVEDLKRGFEDEDGKRKKARGPIKRKRKPMGETIAGD